MKIDVVVVGAGIAGLRCAGELVAAGVDTVVIDAASAVGGRVRTDEVDGFLLDRGFQVLLTAYPEARAALDYEALDLRDFFPGALVRHEGRFQLIADPFRRPLHALRSVGTTVATVGDALRVARLRARTLRGTLGDLMQAPEKTSLEALREAGFSERIIQAFFRPFLGGVYLEPKLRTSSRKLDFVMRMFASGAVAVPARGMQKIPEQLAARIPSDRVMKETQVASIESGRVVPEGTAAIQCREIVLAVDAPAAGRLLGTREPVPTNSVTCHYYSAATSPHDGPYLVLDGEAGGPINNLAVLSDVAPEYSSSGRALISVTTLGLPEGGFEVLDARVRRQLRDWYGEVVDGWELVRGYPIRHALPTQPGDVHRPSSVAPEGVTLCGDYLGNASLNAALASGGAAASSVRDRLRAN